MRLLKYLFEAINNVLRSKSNSLQKKYMTWFMGIVLVPILIIISIVFTYSVSNRNNQIKSNLTKTLNIAENIVSSSINSINTQTTSIVINPRVIQAIASDDPVKDHVNIAYSQELLKNITIANDFVTSASFYSFQSNYLFGTNVGEYIHNFSDHEQIPWYNHFKTTGEFDFIVEADNSEESHICLSKSIYNGNKVIGIAVFYINMNKLLSFNNDEQYVFVSNVDGNVLFSHIPEYTKRNIYQASESLSDLYSGDKLIKITIDSSMAKTKIPYYDATLIVINQKVSYSFLPTYFLLLVIAVIITTLLGFLFSAYLMDIFYSHIAKTISYLTTDTGNNYDETQDELTWIKNQIYTILASNQELEAELAQNILKLKNMHLVSMQIQTNPHFLFNALNLASMNAISELGIDNTTTKIITLISEMTRTTMDIEEYFSDIGNELVLVEKYVQIEKLKYGDVFDVEYDIDSSILKCRAIKMTLQPIVENAFKHGIHRLPKSKRGLVSISIKPHNNVIVFKIRDNGETDNEVIKKANENLKKEVYTIPKHNIGLRNVNSRIRILFGEQFGCKIYRKNNMTVSEMVIPKKHSDE